MTSPVVELLRPSWCSTMRMDFLQRTLNPSVGLRSPQKRVTAAAVILERKSSYIQQQLSN
uniref:Uncharacterized protein n=1 Tax=Arundo donax TaxID=35708 RepID=A0A0A9AM32_ARUDO